MDRTGAIRIEIPKGHDLRPIHDGEHMVADSRRARQTILAADLRPKLIRLHLIVGDREEADR